MDRDFSIGARLRIIAPAETGLMEVDVVMSRSVLTAAALAATLSFSGCSGDDDEAADITQSCTTQQATGGGTIKMCTEVTAAQSTVEQVLASCTQGGGTKSDGACSSAGAVGKCVFGDSHGTSSVYLYQPQTAAQAETFCGQISGAKGTFTAL